MANLILAFVIGVLCGMGYMYLRYNKMMCDNLRELREIRINHAKIQGQMKILNAINGIKEEE